MVKQIFVNLPVKNLNKTKEFFGKLGFTFNPEFTNEKAACMIIGDNIFAMLLNETFFKTFIKKEICDTSKSTEVLLAVSVESRAKVDELMKLGLAAGGQEPRPSQDYGWMFSRALEDLDGHIWEIFYGDESKREKK